MTNFPVGNRPTIRNTDPLPLDPIPRCASRAFCCTSRLSENLELAGFGDCEPGWCVGGLEAEKTIGTLHPYVVILGSKISQEFLLTPRKGHLAMR
jgi:hypothetical protein